VAMHQDSSGRFSSESRSRANRIVLVYGLVAAAYIWISDLLLGAVVDDPKSIVGAQLIKGSLFVLVTALLLLVLLRRAFMRVAIAREEAVHGRELLRSLFGTSSSGLILMDKSGRVDAWNEQAEAILGWREEDVLGKPFPVVDRSGVSCPLGSFVRDVMRDAPEKTDLVLVRDRFHQMRSLRVRLDAVRRSDDAAIATLIVLDRLEES